MPRRIAYSGALTKREWEVVRAIGRALVDKEVAAELGIEFSTVRSHLESIYAKLALRGRAALMRWAWEHKEDHGGGP